MKTKLIKPALNFCQVYIPVLGYLTIPIKRARQMNSFISSQFVGFHLSSVAKEARIGAYVCEGINHISIKSKGTNISQYFLIISLSSTSCGLSGFIRLFIAEVPLKANSEKMGWLLSSLGITSLQTSKFSLLPCSSSWLSSESASSASDSWISSSDGTSS